MTTTINDKDLSRYNQQGLIPGPSESESEYLRRVDYCLQIQDHLNNTTGISLPCYHAGERSLPEEVCTPTKDLYDFSPKWVPVIYDNHKQSFWHGGCAWIFQCDEESPLSAILQLRRSLSDNESVYGLLDKKEIIAHEMCHVGRMAFEEPIFEEVLAYRTSNSGYRRWLGPIVKNSIESGVFVLLLFVIFLADLFFVFFGNEQVFFQMMWLKIIPLLLIGYGLFRLNKRHRQFEMCLNHLKKVCGQDSVASAVAYRLTDEEIILFGKWSTQEILNYAEEQREICLRWMMIYKIYLQPT